MKTNTSTRRLEDMRHFNDQNPNVNPAAQRARVPQLVRELAYSGPVRTVMISPRQTTEIRAVGRKLNGLPVPVQQRIGTGTPHE